MFGLGPRFGSPPEIISIAAQSWVSLFTPDHASTASSLFSTAFWPFSMIHKEVESGALISLAQTYAQEAQRGAIYVMSRAVTSQDLTDIGTMDIY